MTLVIAHRLKNKVSLTSDSRLNFGASGFIDYGIKIFSVPVNIYSQPDRRTKSKELIYSKNMGLAVVGSAMNAYTIKESVSEILQHLHYLSDRTDMSMTGIAKIVYKVFCRTTLDFGDLMQRNGICELILTGYCPQKKVQRVYKFSCDTSGYPIKPNYEEILIDDGMVFFGSGTIEAKKIYQENTNLKPVFIVKRVILESKVDTVGGVIQYGEFLEDNFNIYGVEDYTLKEDGSFNKFHYSLRGVNLYIKELEPDYDGFEVVYKFLRPFKNEKDKLSN